MWWRGGGGVASAAGEGGVMGCGPGGAVAGTVKLNGNWPDRFGFAVPRVTGSEFSTIDTSSPLRNPPPLTVAVPPAASHDVDNATFVDGSTGSTRPMKR